MVLRADLGFRKCRHLQRRLGIGKALQTALAQRIERDDGDAALSRVVKLMEHTRTVDAHVLPEEQNAVGMLEVFEQFSLQSPQNARA